MIELENRLRMEREPPSRMAVRSTYNRANRIENLRNRIPLGELIEFPPAMTQAQLEELPVAVITNEQADCQCAVCFHEFQLNENEVRKLPCNHLYHDKCIFPWLLNNPSCPTCRVSLMNDIEEDFEDAIRRKTMKTFLIVNISSILISEHFIFLTRDLMRHLAESGAESSAESEVESPSVSVTANDDRSPIETRSLRRAPGEPSTSARATNEIGSTRETRRPRRAAALRADIAIQQIYRR